MFLSLSTTINWNTDSKELEQNAGARLRTAALKAEEN